MKRLLPVARCSAALTLLLATSSFAHEAWLLTPAEIEALSVAPVPPLFTSHLWLALAAAVAAALTWIALRVEPQIAAMEQRLLFPVLPHLAPIAPLFIRLGVGVMLILAAFGGLPRHGIALWSQPTFLVPDMSLSPQAQVLIFAQLSVGVLLSLGFLTRLMGAGLILFAILGLVIFGAPFLSYAPHFAAPGLLLMALGPGRVSLDHLCALDIGNTLLAPYRGLLSTVAIALIGLGFVYLGVAYKLLQPTLLIAILEHGGMPTFGLPMPVIALVMTGVEIVCGLLLLAGRLVRPVALAILGAITFLAVVLGETPLFHANLYGTLMVVLLLGHASRKTVRLTLREAL